MRTTVSLESAAPIVRRRLLRWYDRHRRELPWRRNPPDPYATLVSEFMLQQTQVKTVLPYFERFMRRFPTLRSLASASIDDVLPFWAGLGYYRRCHHLHAAACAIVDRHQGRIPKDVEALRALPGVGAYTAGAIASIVFNVAVPAVDGNVCRVLARLRGDDPKSAGSRPLNEMLAARLVAPRRPGDFNQALMELGALICTPRSPDCPRCPLRALCPSRDRTAALPARRKTPPSESPRTLHVVALAILRKEQTFLVRRPDRGLWAGLYMWPTAECLPHADRDAVALNLCRRLLPRAAALPRHAGHVRHVLTHRTVHFDVYVVRVSVGARPTITGRWRLPTSPGTDPPLSTAQRKLEACLVSHASA
ncbi:MAG: A/G-specific adenine glycosylase [Phycisphaerae bacterium]|nr:A/G-specific adenine glycosylase [Phycisphaerae bacterium]